MPVGCRSDAGLSKPIIRRLDKHPNFKCNAPDLIPADFRRSYLLFDNWIDAFKPDFVLCVGDRIEMAAAACAAFHNHVKIGHVYAGVVNTPMSTLDDINRHVISLYADIVFCESVKSADIIRQIWTEIGKINKYYISFYKHLRDNNIHVVGITHLDDLEVDESLVPSEDYDLVLLNPTTLIKESLMIKPNPNRKTICIGPNPDGSCGEGIDYDNVPRPQFFGLLKNCKRFITNSSAAYYEAPHFLEPEQIILVGNRNKNRSTPKKLETGASDKIVKILEVYFDG